MAALTPWRVASSKSLSGPCGTLVDARPDVCVIAWAVRNLLRPLVDYYRHLPDPKRSSKVGAKHGGGNGHGALWKTHERPHKRP